MDWTAGLQAYKRSSPVENVCTIIENWISETCGFPLNYNKCEFMSGYIV